MTVDELREKLAELPGYYEVSVAVTRVYEWSGEEYRATGPCDDVEFGTTRVVVVSL